MTNDLQDIIDGAIGELREWCEVNSDCDPTYDGTLHEFADGSVPVYTGDLMQLAANNIDLVTVTPELGPAFDGEPTPVNIVAANVYEAIINGLHEAWREIEEEREEEGED